MTKTLNLNNVIFASSADAFKNTGVFSTSLTMSGAVLAGATKTVSTTVTLPENQSFAYAMAQYTEFAKGGAATWQKLPTFYANTPSTPTGFLSSAIYFTINGTVVTFNAFFFNPYGGTETIATTTFNINYVTYVISA